MTPVGEISGTMQLSELEAHHRERDAQVQAIRSEMVQIHGMMEPKWEAAIKATSNPRGAQTLYAGETKLQHLERRVMQLLGIMKDKGIDPPEEGK
jgi:hypothetical protein